MNVDIWTWGTGGPFGRELGVGPNRRRRGHTATSIIISGECEDEEAGIHFMIDAGAPSVETMVEKGVLVPDVLFLTHPHLDHVSDLDRLANSRRRGLMVQRGVRDFETAKSPFRPLAVIGTEDCLNHPQDGVKARFGYLNGLVTWVPVSKYDLWHSVRRSDGAVFPSRASVETENLFPLEFKLLPVRHSKHAPGSCLFVFRFGSGVFREGPDEEKRIRFRNVVISGDFKSMEDWVVGNSDLRDPVCMVLDSNTIRASGRYHASLEENKALIERWCSGDEGVLVLLNHLSGFADYTDGYYDHVPDDEDWKAAVGKFVPPPMVAVRIAEDGECHRII